MYTLYYAPGLASMAPHFVLRELQVDHRLVFIDRSVGAHKTQEYLFLNPNGRIPTFDDDGHVIFEAAAICLHLADRHPDAGLMAKSGDPQRTDQYKWLMFLTNTLQADFWQFYRPEFYVGPSQRAEFRATMESHIHRHLTVLDNALDGRRFLGGDLPSIPDFYFLMLVFWCRGLARNDVPYSGISRAANEMLKRRAVREVFELEGLQPFSF